MGTLSTAKKAPTIQALTGIRIIAATWVVVEHFRQPLFALFKIPGSGKDLVDSGYLGVEIFFILSGFIISYNYAERLQIFSWTEYRHFLLLRFARLYPVHLVTFVLVGLLVTAAATRGVNLASAGKYDALNFFMNLTLLQAVPPATAWNGPAWSISAEAAAYILFPILAVLTAKTHTRGRLLLGVTVALLIPIIGIYFLPSGVNFSPTNPIAIWLRITGEFSAGCFLWAYWSNYPKMRISGDFVALLGASGIIGVVVVTPAQGPFDFLALPFVVILILGCVAASGVARRLLSSGPMDYGGRISYSLYMWHFIVLMIGGKLLPWASFIHSSLLVRISILISYYAAALAGAVFMYHFVEEPGRRLLRRFDTKASSDSPLSVEIDLAKEAFSDPYLGNSSGTQKAAGISGRSVRGRHASPGIAVAG